MSRKRKRIKSALDKRIEEIGLIAAADEVINESRKHDFDEMCRKRGITEDEWWQKNAYTTPLSFAMVKGKP